MERRGRAASSGGRGESRAPIGFGTENGGADDWRDIRRDDRWRIGQGRYTVNLLDEPIWRLAYRDPERRLSALWQVYQRDWSLDEAEAALVKMVASVRRHREPEGRRRAKRSTCCLPAR